MHKPKIFPRATTPFRTRLPVVTSHVVRVLLLTVKRRFDIEVQLLEARRAESLLFCPYLMSLISTALFPTFIRLPVPPSSAFF